MSEKHIVRALVIGGEFVCEKIISRVKICRGIFTDNGFTVFDYVIREIVGTDVDDFKVVCGDDLTSRHICFESDNIHLLIGKSVHQGSNAKGDKKCEYDTDNSDDRS